MLNGRNCDDRDRVLDALERVAVVRVSVPERNDVFIIADRDDCTADLVTDIKLLADDRQDLCESVLCISTMAL